MRTTLITGRPATEAAAVPAARIIDGVKIYGSGATAVRALDAISAEFAGGAFTAIMGPSGSGKSTLLHCLAGLDRLTSGDSLAAPVSKVSGVRAVALDIEGYAQLVGKNGKAIGLATGGPPTLGMNWVSDAGLSPLRPDRHRRGTAQRSPGHELHE